jgi:endoplasmic reticulum chaperone BiP
MVAAAAKLHCRELESSESVSAAAALAQGSGEQYILVFDLGGGTFDVSLLTIDNGVFEVMATSGDTHLGGEDFDRRTMDFMLKQFQKKSGVDASKDKRALQKLRREVERAKRQLSTTHQQRIEIEAFNGGKDFSETLTRAKFEELNVDLFKSTIDPVKKVLQDSGLDKTQIDQIVLVGGSTRIPKIQVPSPPALQSHLLTSLPQISLIRKFLDPCP